MSQPRCPRGHFTAETCRACEQWVDEVAVERATYGDPVPLTPVERAAAIDYLTRRGRSGRQIAELLRVARRTVERHRARARQVSDAA